MPYNNSHLVEVTCGFQFPQETVEWDGTYFGQFFEKIKNSGFTEKQERRGFQIEINAVSSDAKRPAVSSSETPDDQMIFMNPLKSWAIMLSRGKISFHVVKDYTSWEDFLSNFIVPYYEKYLELGLGNGNRSCNVLYLNRFKKEFDVNLSHYFSILGDLPKGVNQELNCNVNRVFGSGNNVLVVRLNLQPVLSDSKNVINLECGAICQNPDLMNSDNWRDQANSTHAPIKDFFESMITETLRNEL